MKEKIEDTVIGILLIGVFIFIMGVAGYIETHYTREATIVDVVSDEVVVIDEFGNEWSFIGDGYKVNDNVTLVIYNNTTMNTTVDDEIIDIK